MARRKVDKAARQEPLVLSPVDQTSGAPTSRADYVQAVLRQNIVSGHLSPGTQIPQDEVALQLGVSITPVREALRRLESAGLIQYEAHFGAIVTELNPQDIEELYLLRGVVEGLAARLAATNITPDQLTALGDLHRLAQEASDAGDVAAMSQGSREFHQAIAEAGGRRVIARHLKQIWEAHPVPVTQSVWSRREVAVNALDYHQRILVALDRRDASEAERLMIEHVELALAERIETRADQDLDTTGTS